MYNKEIDQKWQKLWKENHIYSFDKSSNKPKLYLLEMFSYPSGSKLHLGHWYNYVLSDAYGRYKKMNGYNLFHPTGFDAFGLPAENYAIKTGIHPKESTYQNIDSMKKQFEEMGTSYDWDYELITSDPSYYKWTQWLFGELYKAGMAYRKEAPVNFCPSCNTVLANEQVIDGRCERCDTLVERRKLKQWFFRITDYAEELLENLDKLDWPELTKKIQTNWIGKSIGTEIEFYLEENQDVKLPVFTTRPDTIFGVTYLAIAPELENIKEFITEEQSEKAEEYIYEASHLSDIERQIQTREKTGIFTGKYAINPLNDKKIPIYIADYVLAHYGSGIVMGVPAHDDRDFEFAKTHSIGIVQVITNLEENIDVVKENQAFLDESENTKIINSNNFNGLNVPNFKDKIIEYIKENNLGKDKIQYKLKDWLVSRQRYWGAPIPIIYCDKCGEVLDENLPVLLPEDVEFRPDGISPLAKSDEFINTICPKCGGSARREVDTLDTFVCSSWYFLRFPFANDNEEAFRKEEVDKILPVDLYVGGKEHASMHLIYARYITKVLRDLGYLNFNEPFLRLIHQGLILGPDGNKMSKSKGNVISPDNYINKYGADTLKMYLMFGFSFTEGGPWDDDGIPAMSKYFDRIELFIDRFLKKKLEIKTENKKDAEENKQEAIKNLEYHHNRVIKAVGDDLEQLEFNTAIARLMELTNEMIKFEQNINTNKELEILEQVINDFILLLSVFASHFGQELWGKLGKFTWTYLENWPKYDENKLILEYVKLAIQVNGKLRQVIEIKKDLKQEEIKKIVFSDSKIKEYTENKTIVKEIYVKNKIYNIVIK